jgi:hypothetical protein
MSIEDIERFNPELAKRIRSAMPDKPSCSIEEI